MALATSPLETRENMNALIIETAFLGDAIVSLALAHAIKGVEPEAQVTYLVRPGVDEVLQASPDVTRAIVFDKHGSESGSDGIRKKSEMLNEFGFDTLFLLHSSLRSQALASRMDCNTKIGFKAMTRAALTCRIPDAGWSNRYERATLLLRAIIPHVELAALPRIIPPVVPDIHEFVSRFPACMALAPGSAWETKQWGNGKYSELASKLVNHGIGVIIIGSESEMEAAAHIREVCREGFVLALAGRTSFIESTYAIARSRLLIANDSAPVHAAVAVGTKTLAIFGPTVPAFGFAPPRERGAVIEQAGLWCRPCTSHGSHTCPIYSHECMNGIDVSTVLKQIRTESPDLFMT